MRDDARAITMSCAARNVVGISFKPKDGINFMRGCKAADERPGPNRDGRLTGHFGPVGHFPIARRTGAAGHHANADPGTDP